MDVPVFYCVAGVTDPVHDVSISSVQGDGQTIYDSDDLYCQALGNPPPSFSWTQISDGGKQMTTMGVSMASGGGAITSVNGSTVPASLLHNMTTWRCTATNVVNGVRTSVSANIGPLVIGKYAVEPKHFLLSIDLQCGCSHLR